MGKGQRGPAPLSFYHLGPHFAAPQLDKNRFLDSVHRRIIRPARCEREHGELSPLRGDPYNEKSGVRRRQRAGDPAVTARPGASRSARRRHAWATRGTLPRWPRRHVPAPTRHTCRSRKPQKGRTAMQFGTYPLSHLGLRVSDLARAKRFYVDTLGFGLLRETPGQVLIDAHGMVFALIGQAEQTDTADRFDPFRIGLDHFALAIADAGELEGLREQLDAAGCPTMASSRILPQAPPTSASMIPTASPGSCMILQPAVGAEAPTAVAARAEITASAGSGWSGRRRCAGCGAGSAPGRSCNTPGDAGRAPPHRPSWPRSSPTSPTPPPDAAAPAPT